MTNATLIIIFCILLLLAYVFDLTASLTKIPSVFLLLVLGWLSKQLVLKLGISVPELTHLLPFLGKIGLILIVLEGSLELEVNRGNLRVIRRSFLLAVLPFLTLSFSLGFLCSWWYDCSLRSGLLNAIPLAIISGAVAISSAKHFSQADRDFITYESSFSNISGVLFFNFVVLYTGNWWRDILFFTWDIGLIIVVSLLATLALALLLKKINHSVKFLPIIIILILIYALVGKYHLPELIFTMVFGILLENTKKLKQSLLIRSFKANINFDVLFREVHKFKEIVGEGAFLLRTCFFLLFGFSIENHELLNIRATFGALALMLLIIAVRYIFLKLWRMPVYPLLFMAPRGLITILLFLSIPEGFSLPFIDRTLLIQLILLATFVMMIGVFMTPAKEAALKKSAPGEVRFP